MPCRASCSKMTEEEGLESLSEQSEGLEEQRVFMVRCRQFYEHSSSNIPISYKACIESSLQHCVWRTRCQLPRVSNKRYY
jgi:hypothetical protein